MIDEVWVVFDSTEPDAAVLATATSIEAVITTIGDTVNLMMHTDVGINLTNAGQALVVNAMAKDSYTDADPTEREWRAEKHCLTTT